MNTGITRFDISKDGEVRYKILKPASELSYFSAQFKTFMLLFVLLAVTVMVFSNLFTSYGAPIRLINVSERVEGGAKKTAPGGWRQQSEMRGS